VAPFVSACSASPLERHRSTPTTNLAPSPGILSVLVTLVTRTFIPYHPTLATAAIPAERLISWCWVIPPGHSCATSRFDTPAEWLENLHSLRIRLAVQQRCLNRCPSTFLEQHSRE